VGVVGQDEAWTWRCPLPFRAPDLKMTLGLTAYDDDVTPSSIQLTLYHNGEPIHSFGQDGIYPGKVYEQMFFQLVEYLHMLKEVADERAAALAAANRCLAAL